MKNSKAWFRLDGLWRNLLVLAIGAAMGFGFSFFVPHVYAGEAAIKIGKVAVYPQRTTVTRARMNLTVVKKYTRFLHARPIEIPSGLIEDLRAGYQVPRARVGKIDPPYLYNLSLRDGDVVILSARGSSPEQVRQFLDQIVKTIISRHDEILSVQKTLIEQQFLMMGEQMNFGSDELPTFISALLDALALRNQRVLSAERLTEAAENIFEIYQDFGEALMPVNLHPSRVVLEPTAYSERLHPDRVLFALVGATLSLLLLLFVYAWRELNILSILQNLKKSSANTNA